MSAFLVCTMCLRRIDYQSFAINNLGEARCCVCGCTRFGHSVQFVDGPTADRAHHALCDELATAADGGVS